MLVVVSLGVATVIKPREEYVANGQMPDTNIKYSGERGRNGKKSPHVVSITHY